MKRTILLALATIFTGNSYAIETGKSTEDSIDKYIQKLNDLSEKVTQQRLQSLITILEAVTKIDGLRKFAAQDVFAEHEMKNFSDQEIIELAKTIAGYDLIRDIKNKMVDEYQANASFAQEVNAAYLGKLKLLSLKEQISELLDLIKIIVKAPNIQPFLRDLKGVLKNSYIALAK